MKAIFSIALATLVLGASTLFGQTATVAPEEGATVIGSFTMDLDVLSEPQPDVQFSVEVGTAGVTETTLWLTSDGDVIVTVATDEVGTWKDSDPIYHNATTDYTYDKLGATTVWMASELGYNVGPETEVKLVKSADSTIHGQRKYFIAENGANTEVKLMNADGTY
ncbi:MAG: hypothetical protein AB7H80_11780 [Candidatus Kapaibacterium sp.]